MHMHQLNVVVSDMEATVSFYRLLGLDIPAVDPQWQEWQLHHRSATLPGGLDLDFDSEEFARVWNRGAIRARGASRNVIGFRVESRAAVDACYERMIHAGYAGQQPPYDAFWGSRYAIVEDPDGNAVGLMSEPDPALRSQPTLPAS